MEIVQITKLIMFVVYTVMLWLTFRIWYADLFHTKDTESKQFDNDSTSVVERLKTERLQKENDRLKIFCEEKEAKINGISTQWLQEIETSNRQTARLADMKKQNEVLFEAFKTVQATNKRYAQTFGKRIAEAKSLRCFRISYDDGTFNSGITGNELDSMVQLMQGKPISIARQQQAVHAARKSEGTELYELLTAQIAGAKQRLQAIYDAETESDNRDADYGDMEVMKYIYV